jgi:uncharacterized protein YbjT (DUF2867 family)
MSGTILTIGAGGKFAGLVIPALTGRGFTICGMVRKADAAAQVTGQDTTEVAVGDLADPAAMARALKGVDRDFHIAPVNLPDEAETGRAFAAAMVSEKVKAQTLIDCGHFKTEERPEFVVGKILALAALSAALSKQDRRSP